LINKDGNTSFMLACSYPISIKVALDIMKHPHFNYASLNYVNSHGNNSLMCALSNFDDKKSELAQEILLRPEFNSINRINKVGMSCLMLACSFKFNVVANKILSRDDFTQIYNLNTQGFSAMEIAQRNDLYDVIYHIQYNISRFTEDKINLDQVFKIIKKYSSEIIHLQIRLTNLQSELKISTNRMKKFIETASKDEMTVYYKFMRSCEKERELEQIKNSIFGRAITDHTFLQKYGDDYILLCKIIDVLENHPQDINKKIFNINVHLNKIQVEKSKFQAKYDVAIKYNLTLEEPILYTTTLRLNDYKLL